MEKVKTHKHTKFDNRNAIIDQRLVVIDSK